jgi:hypothetical protein
LHQLRVLPRKDDDAVGPDSVAEDGAAKQDEFVVQGIVFSLPRKSALESREDKTRVNNQSIGKHGKKEFFGYNFLVGLLHAALQISNGNWPIVKKSLVFRLVVPGKVVVWRLAVNLPVELAEGVLVLSEVAVRVLQALAGL